jgi:hypothetical protein
MLLDMVRGRRFPWSVAAVACLVVGCRSVPPRPAPEARRAATETIETSLFLIGDAGAPDPRGEPVLEALRRELERAPERSFVVFLGDNVYPRGLPAPGAPGHSEGRRRLDAQIDAILGSGARGLFIPGNHDWDRSGREGLARVRRQEEYVVGRGGSRVTFLPRHGCPGPVVDDVGAQLRLVALDTQWWLHEGEKPHGAGSGCEPGTDAEVVAALRQALAGAAPRRAVVLAHHPLVSGGTHGGHFSLADHLFPLRAWKGWLWLPLPVVGSLYPVTRREGVFSQDIPAPPYRHMIESLESAFDEDPPFLWASGHEHGLQVLEGREARWLLVSGAGILGHTRAPAWIPSTRFASGDAGFMRLDVLWNGRMRLTVLAVDREARAAESFVLDLE